MLSWKQQKKVMEHLLLRKKISNYNCRPERYLFGMAVFYVIGKCSNVVRSQGECAAFSYRLAAGPTFFTLKEKINNMECVKM